jgi:hypothetical protein
VKFFYTIPTLFLACTLQGQTSNADAISPPEKTFLALVQQDTVSNAVCYLPRKYNIGIENPDTGRLVLVKTGRKISFILEGTHRVYRPDPDRRGKLERWDNTIFTGDNFGTMVFTRKDTICQYGGAGYWRHRNFITWYNEPSKGWEFLQGEMGVENIRTPYQYDSSLDALIVLGSQYINYEERKASYRNSVYRYDFPTRQWSETGTLRNSVPGHAEPIPDGDIIAATKYGTLVRQGPGFILIDLAGNRIGQLSPAFNAALLQVMGDGVRDDASRPLIIHLKDTLHVIRERDRKTEHLRLRLSTSDLKAFLPQAVYRQVDTARWITILLFLLPLSAIGIFIFRRMRAGKAPDHEEQTDVLAQTAGTQEETVPKKENGIVPADSDVLPRDQPSINPSALSIFRNSLPSADWKLFTSLIRSSADGSTMDADQINYILGVSQKNPMIQKSNRSLAVTRINRSFMQCTGHTAELIQRKRDDIERRTYNYFIEKGLAMEVQRNLQA